jgi:predicted negative regulator of RcsB-dependent stress response
MAFEEYDDFEQEKLVKDWIKSNWLTIALGIGLGLGGVIGINYWKATQQQQRYKMAADYNSFEEVMKLSEFDEAKATLDEMEKISGTNFYTIQAHMMLAKEFVEKEELEKASVELLSIINSKPDQLITEFAKLRLARIYNAMDKYDDALTLVNGILSESFLSMAKEIQGDAYRAKGENEKAQSAYEQASSEGEGYSGKKNIEIKLENS